MSFQEAKDYVPAPQNFDLTMDLSSLSNVPLMLAPTNFWGRIMKLPIPTIEEVKKRRLIIWVASNCCRTTWDRQGYVKELAASLERQRSRDELYQLPMIDFAGYCLNNTPPSATDLPQDYSEALIKGCEDEPLDTKRCSQEDSRIAKKMAEVYGRYMFVLSAVNNIENTNLDEKFYEPFLSNSGYIHILTLFINASPCPY